jgi:hypothetical protein
LKVVVAHEQAHISNEALARLPLAALSYKQQEVYAQQQQQQQRSHHMLHIGRRSDVRDQVSCRLSLSGSLVLQATQRDMHNSNDSSSSTTTTSSKGFSYRLMLRMVRACRDIHASAHRGTACMKAQGMKACYYFFSKLWLLPHIE